MNLYLIKFIVLIGISYSTAYKSAIEYFIQNKTLKYSTVEIINDNNDNLTKCWIEYNYYFENFRTHVNESNTSTLKVGVFSLGSDVPTFNHSISSNIVKGHIEDLLVLLLEHYNITIETVLINNLASTNNTDIIICHPHLKNVPQNIAKLFSVSTNSMVLVYNPDKLRFTRDLFILTFTGSLWLVFISVLIFLAICLRFATNQYSLTKSHYEDWTWVEITLWATAAACQQGLSRTPQGFACCTIFFLGYVMTYLLYTGFAAAITSILVKNVDTRNDLLSICFSKLHLTSLDIDKIYITEYKTQFMSTRFVKTFNHFFQELNEENRIGIGSSSSVQHFILDNFSKDQISTFQMFTTNIKYSDDILITQKSPWAEKLKTIFLKTREFGILQNILLRNKRPYPLNTQNNHYSSPGQKHVASAIFLFCGGASAAIILLIFEFILYFFKHRQQYVKKY